MNDVSAAKKCWLNCSCRVVTCANDDQEERWCASSLDLMIKPVTAKDDRGTISSTLRVPEFTVSLNLISATRRGMAEKIIDDFVSVTGLDTSTIKQKAV